MKLSAAEVFEMNLYYREVIGRDGAPGFVKEIDIIKLLDHVSALEEEMALLKKGSGVGFEIEPKRSRSGSRKKKPAADEVPAGQIDIFEIGGDE